jgi:hypothetical protein
LFSRVVLVILKGVLKFFSKLTPKPRDPYAEKKENDQKKVKNRIRKRLIAYLLDCAT